MAVRVEVAGLPEANKAINRLIGQLPQLIRIAALNVLPDIEHALEREVRRAIDDRTTRRTGTLRQSVIIRGRYFGRRIGLRASFPATRYLTPPGRGRRDASKMGQYAFVVDHKVRFGRLAANRFRRSRVTNQLITAEFVRLLSLL